MVQVLMFSFTSSLLVSCHTQSVISQYVPGFYSTMSPHTFTSPESFGFSEPTAYAVTGFSSSKYFPSLKKIKEQPKIYRVLSHKYRLESSGYNVPNIKHYQDEVHHDVPAHYEFRYEVHDKHNGAEFGHAEYRMGNVAKGQYMVVLPDGRKQIVDYIADSNGYRPTIRYVDAHSEVTYGR